jgi:hypothetical protein
MLSPAELRRRLEQTCRILALLALGALFWRTMLPPSTDAGAASARTTAALSDALPMWTTIAPRSADLALDSIPGPATRDWLRALVAAGADVRWRQTRTLPRAAVSIETQSAPGGRSRLTLVAAPGQTVVTSDDAGTVDSASLGASGVRTLDATLEGPLSASAHGMTLRTAIRDSVLLRRILVLARAGWEGKFVVAALEEAGWRVDTRFTVAPDIAVRQGTGPIDTARYAAVIALDESAAPSAATIARYAGDGGGVIVTASAAPVFAAIIPARPTRRIEARLGALLTATPRAGLDATALSPTAPRGEAAPSRLPSPVSRLTESPVVLERRGTSPVVVASRFALGRVLVMAYSDTWRWRMTGGDEAVAAHRQWWSGLVASVAYAPRLPIPTTATIDPAPFASLVAALGAPSSAADGARLAPSGWWTPALFGLLLFALLAEWSSRRTRGAR